MRVSVVTPDSTFFQGEAGFVVLPSLDGQIGVLSKHAPMIARLGHGVAKVKPSLDSSEETKIAIYGGFCKVQDDTVNVLASGAAKADGKTQAEAEQALSAARAEVKRLKDAGTTGSALAEAEEQVLRAQAFVALLS
ncbi:MAG: ATP synthase F1 subunit epsilon [Planctomycetota bacterium]